MPKSARKLADMSLSDQIKASQTEEDTAEDKAEPVTGTKVEVFNDIPIPTGRAARESVYKWDIQKGQSFFVVDPDVAQDKLIGRLTTACTNRNKKGEARFIARKYEHEGVKGVMVWRTK